MWVSQVVECGFLQGGLGWLVSVGQVDSLVGWALVA